VEDVEGMCRLWVQPFFEAISELPREIDVEQSVLSRASAPTNRPRQRLDPVDIRDVDSKHRFWLPAECRPPPLLGETGDITPV